MPPLGMVRALAVALVLASACEGRDADRGIAARGSPAQAVSPRPAAAPADPPADASGADVAAIDRPPAPVPDDVARGIELRTIVRGLHRPVALVVAPGDPRHRLFVVEQRGAIRVIEHGKLARRPFFTFRDLGTGEEQGLLGLAFHPRFASNGKLYVNYTSRDAATHVVEYRVSARDPDVVDPSTARELVRIAQPYANHNGGNLLFGPDGKLYTGMGDGGSENDPLGNGQNPNTLLSKLLRFDVAAARPTPEIVDGGLRNPWRFWFDAKTGDLYIGDVGQNQWEEVDVVAGTDHTQHDFGWSLMEGAHCFDRRLGMTTERCDRTGLTLPVVEYSHAQGCSITGGVTYRGEALPALDGRYFYADYCTGILRSFKWEGGTVRDHWDWTDALNTRKRLAQISSFGVDADGEVYLVTLTGTIYELAPRAPAARR